MGHPAPTWFNDPEPPWPKLANFLNLYVAALEQQQQKHQQHNCIVEWAQLRNNITMNGPLLDCHKRVLFLLYKMPTCCLLLVQLVQTSQGATNTMISSKLMTTKDFTDAANASATITTWHRYLLLCNLLLADKLCNYNCFFCLFKGL